MYHLMSWNVDGYTDAIHDWLKELLETEEPDVIFISETKKPLHILQTRFDELSNYHAIINAHIPTRWHGVAMLIHAKHKYERFSIQMNIPVRKDTHTDEASTGRAIAIKLNDDINIIGSYTPNSGQSDPVKLAYRTEIWDPAFVSLLEIFRKINPTIWMGDINVALTENDVSDPIRMSSWSGFTPQERINLDCILSSEYWVDAWRMQHHTETGYSWVGRVRCPEHGMRLDNIIVSSDLTSRVIDTYILQECSEDTDHLPVGLILKAPTGQPS
jgi:exodeoxyribonuclease-3